MQAIETILFVIFCPGKLVYLAWDRVTLILLKKTQMMQKECLLQEFRYGEDLLTVGRAIRLVRGLEKGVLTDAARKKVSQSHRIIADIVRNHRIVYGINTGFGPLCTTRIDEQDTKTLQYNLLMSHSVGVGNPVDREIAKLMLILKAHSLAKGYSGVSPDTLGRIIWHIDQDVIPCVPEQGSVGASGDLAPLSHLFLPLIGMGTVCSGDGMKPAEEVLQQLGMQPIELGPKEGLALINGTQFMSAHAVMIVEKMQNCLDHADIIAAINLEAMMGSVKSFDEELHTLRPYAGCVYVAERMRILLQNSEIVESHRNCTRCRILFAALHSAVHGSSGMPGST